MVETGLSCSETECVLTSREYWPIKRVSCIAQIIPRRRFTSITANSGYAHARVARHDIALKRGRSNRILAGSNLRPSEMKHWAYIFQIYSVMSLIRMPVEIDDALSYLYMFDMKRLP